MVDGFPFPVKADTKTHVSEGIPPPEYKFTLLKYEENIQTSPFEGVVASEELQTQLGCDTEFDKVSLKKPTKNFDYQIHLIYGPETLQKGCESEWLVKFISKFDDTEFLNQVQFDIFVLDDTGEVSRSFSSDQGRDYLYSPSGQYEVDYLVQEDPGTANYRLLIYGLAPEGIFPSTAWDTLDFEIPVSGTDGETIPEPVPTKIPDWIKNNAGWWANGDIDDNSFVQGIQFLIKEGIM